jgi:alpha-tubulin suppressor-like RCC1 family protein
VAISGQDHTIGLKADGTVVIAGRHAYSEKIQAWRDIVAIGAGFQHSVGVKKDGTCVAAGMNPDGECNVAEWTDIVTVACA